MSERKIPIARDDAEIRAWHESNRRAWNEAAGWYAASNEEAIRALRAGESNLHPVERRNLGDLATWCETAIHLQCASGFDTLSLLVEGVKSVVGIDISENQIANAKLRSEALGANARWYVCDVLDTPEELDGSADLVYTGRGAIDWIHDLNAWARVCARLLKPGGVVHVFDNHPVTILFQPDVDDYVLTDYDYFGQAIVSKGWPVGYIDQAVGKSEDLSDKVERVWTLSEVFSALSAAGLVVEHLGEHPDAYFPFFLDTMPEERRGRIPLTFSILARRPPRP